jgi:hypothetical protein
MDMAQIIDSIIVDTLENGGATYRLDGTPETEPVTLVGGAEDFSGTRIAEVIIPLEDLTPEAMQEAFERIQRLAPSARFGTWIEDGRVVIDASDAFEDLVTAVSVARVRGERAVYTIGVGETVTA